MLLTFDRNYILTLLPSQKLIISLLTTNNHWLSQAPLVGSSEPSLPGVVEQMQPQFISRFLEGQSGVTIKSVSCGDMFTTCMTGWWAVSLRAAIAEITSVSGRPQSEESCYRKSIFILSFVPTCTHPAVHHCKTLTRHFEATYESADIMKFYWTFDQIQSFESVSTRNINISMFYSLEATVSPKLKLRLPDRFTLLGSCHQSIKMKDFFSLLSCLSFITFLFSKAD